MRNPNLLFDYTDWYSVNQHQQNKLLEEINNIDGNQLLNSAIEDLCDYFEKKYWVEVPTLDIENIVSDQHEKKIDVSNDFTRAISNRNQPFYIDGTSIEITIPFDGDSELFKVRPTSYTLNPPRAEIRNNHIILEIEGVDLTSENVQRHIKSTISKIEQYLSTLRNDAQSLNSGLKSSARSAIEQRREKLLKDRNLLGDLGFKIKERSEHSQTYTTPDVRKKISPSFPAASTTPYKPEPVLHDKDYDHILSVIQNMVQVMERSPAAFKTMNEEAIRDHFLVQLNGHYEGNATGETFNCQGKTDILIRSDGKNIFIGECKFWSGPKKLIETIDQLLSYSSWRDTKVAVIIF